MAPWVWMTYLGAETLGSWAERQAQALDAVDLLLDAIMDSAVEGLPVSSTAVQAAVLLLAEARVTSRLLLEEVDFANRMARETGGEK